MKKIFGVENWIPSTQFYSQKANIDPEIVSDSFYDARSDGSSNDDEDIRYLSFPEFMKSSTDEDEIADVEMPQETDNNFLPDDSGQRHSGDLPILVSPDWKLFNCRHNETTFPGFLEICSAIRISPIIDPTDSNNKKRAKMGNYQPLKYQFPHKQIVETNKCPGPRNRFCYSRPSMKTIVSYASNSCPEVAIKHSSKKIMPLNKKKNCLSLHFDSKAYFQTSVNMRCSEYWNAIKSNIPPEKKRKLLPIVRNSTKVPNQPLFQKSTTNKLIEVDHSDEIYKSFVSTGEDNDIVCEDIKMESAKSINKSQYVRHTISNNDSTENEESFDECEAESEESEVEINNNPSGIQLPKETLNSTFCVEERNLKAVNQNEIYNDKNREILMPNNKVDFFSENKPIVLEYLDYETKKSEALIAYPVVCLETTKSLESGHLTKQDMVKRFMKIGILTCEKPIGIIHGVKDMLLSYKKKLQHKKSSTDTETNHSHQQFTDPKNTEYCHTIAITRTPFTKRSFKSKIPCSLKSKEDVAKRKVRSEEYISDIKTPLSVKFSQSSLSTNTYVKGNRKMLPNKEDFFSSTEKATTISRKRGNREEIISSDFKSFFRALAKLGNRLKSGAAITKTNSNFWLKKTGVVCDKESVRVADEYFSEIAGRKLVLNISDYIQYLIAVSRIKKTTLCNLVTQLKTIDISEVTQIKRVPSSEDSTFSSKTVSSAQLLRKKASTPKTNIKISSRSKIPVSSPKTKSDLRQ